MSELCMDTVIKGVRYTVQILPFDLLMRMISMYLPIVLPFELCIGGDDGIIFTVRRVIRKTKSKLSDITIQSNSQNDGKISLHDEFVDEMIRKWKQTLHPNESVDERTG